MNKFSKSYKFFQFINYVIMILVLIVSIFPYLNTLAKALNDGNDTMLGGLTIYPRVFTWQNFSMLLSDKSIYSSFVISVLRVVVGVTLGLVTQFCMAYALSHENLPGRRTFLKMLVIPGFISGGIIPTYLLMVKSGMINNFLVYILPSLVGFYNITVMRTYIESSVPRSLEEAAELDGANKLVVLCKIVVPLCKPIIASMVLFMAVHHWNDWSTTLQYITDERLYTLQYNLMQVVKESERIQKLLQQAQITGETITDTVRSTPDALIAAQVIITTVPIILVYPFLQKYFVQGVTLGAVK